ncbi:MAG: arabinogalactan endo-1,4-beta-galactosidase [Bacteroidales bacterium]|jgi:arabinogalactan endo-1,4-beta-galactosidase|nr:arabinogalactan endo-1,4-beta-galactosidase [Bacteroidales bacterium]MCI2121659.1 arabinogalactan endo-1,4-beta-galactosidase [Bacteroidales bacterium]MCI2144973.1 arabinogalactan endo-1,4-beta-galactosidase [Bacteroidales bacterium]
MKNRTFAILLGVVAIAVVSGAFCFQGCRETIGGGNGNTDTTGTDSVIFAKGADISWVTEMEAAGIGFYDAEGVETDCFALMKSLGMNSIRLRVWVNPTDGWCGLEDVVAKAKRASALDMRVMIDFHYSDSWADPSKQNKPAAWESLDLYGLESALSDHTESVLNALKEAGVTPEWVQIGNETSDGFLWETGRASTNMSNYAKLTEAGYEAVKSVFPKSKVIVHIDNGWEDVTHFTWIFDGLKENGCKWDAIGMSLYPSASNYSAYVSQCISNIVALNAEYSTPVMICEVGFPYDDPTDGKEYLSTLIRQAKAVSDNGCLGVFYWEPECYSKWNGYTLGAFDNSGRPTIALDAFSE